MGRPTVKDVADAAGVSTATVSRVLSGRRATGSDVAERVRQAARDLDWTPDYVGRALRDRRTDTIGLVIPDVTNPFFPELIQRIEYHARAAGSGILLVDARNDPDEERRVTTQLIQRRVDAILMSPCHVTDSLALVEEVSAQVRLVQVDRVVTTAVDHVRTDQFPPMAVLERTLGAGRTVTAAFVGSDLSVSTSAARQEAFLRYFGATDAGARNRAFVGDFTVDFGRRAAERLLSEHPDVNVVICASDMIAFGVIQELRRRGKDVPGDVAVSGWDDTLLSIASQPTITTVRQPVDEMARLAVDALKVEDADVRVTLELAEVLHRQSTSV